MISNLYTIIKIFGPNNPFPRPSHMDIRGCDENKIIQSNHVEEITSGLYI